MTTTLTKNVGQRVLVSGGKFYGAGRITKVNQKNLAVQLENGPHLKPCAPVFCTDLEEDATVPPKYATIMSGYDAVPSQVPGALVRLSNCGDAAYVVMSDKGDRINVALLGGDGGYYVKAARLTVQPISVEDALIYLTRA